MQVSVENIGTLGRRLNVAIPADQLEAEIQQRLQRISRSAKIPGFRPGKVPIKVIESKYGGQALSEAAGELIERSLYEALAQQGLSPAASPEIEPKTLQRGKDLEYAANFEVFPQVERTDLSGIKIKCPQSEITDDDVDRTIEKMRTQRTNWVDAARESREGDQLIMDFVGRIEDEPFPGGKGDDYSVVLGKGSLLPDFEQGLLGVKTEEEKSIAVKFPEDYHGEEVAGTTAQFDVQVKQVLEAKLPEVDEEFAKSFGIESGDVWQLKNEVKESLNRELNERISQVTRERVLDALLRVNDIEVPQKLVEQEIDRTIESNRQTLAQQGIPPDKYNPEREGLTDDARRRVQLGVVIRAIVEKKQMQPDETRVRARIDQIASSYQDPPALVQWYYADKSRLMRVQSVVLEEQVVEELLQSAEVEHEQIAFKNLVENQ